MGLGLLGECDTNELRTAHRLTPLHRWLVVVVLLGAIAGCSSSGAQSSDELQAQQQIKANIVGMCQDQEIEDCSILQGTPQDPNVQVYGSTAFVFTKIANTDLGKHNATDLCHLIAAADHNGDTAVRIANFNHVKIDGGSGNDELASCDTPD